MTDVIQSIDHYLIAVYESKFKHDESHYPEKGECESEVSIIAKITIRNKNGHLDQTSTNQPYNDLLLQV